MSHHQSSKVQRVFSWMHTAKLLCCFFCIFLSIVFSASEQRQDFSGGLSGPLLSNCIEWSSEWSPCSHSCGPGVSTRTTNRKWSCRLQTETRLCQVRPCQTLLPGLRRLQQVRQHALVTSCYSYQEQTDVVFQNKVSSGDITAGTISNYLS